MPDLDVLIRMQHISGAIYDINVKIGNGVPANSNPAIPFVNGPVLTEVDIINNFKAISSDSDADQLSYQFDWGDGVVTDWIGPFNYSDSCSANYTWTQNGQYDIKVRSKDVWNALSDWSPLRTTSVGCCIIERGNVDGDVGNIIDISDLVYLVDFMFTGGPAPLCSKEANVDSDAGDIVDISDLVYLVDFMFTGGPQPGNCP